MSRPIPLHSRAFGASYRANFAYRIPTATLDPASHSIQGQHLYDTPSRHTLLPRTAAKIQAVCQCYCSKNVFSGITLCDLTFW
jgi:hypothetical protein